MRSLSVLRNQSTPMLSRTSLKEWANIEWESRTRANHRAFYTLAERERYVFRISVIKSIPIWIGRVLVFKDPRLWPVRGGKALPSRQWRSTPIWCPCSLIFVTHDWRTRCSEWITTIISTHRGLGCTLYQPLQLEPTLQRPTLVRHCLFDDVMLVQWYWVCIYRNDWYRI